MNEADELVKTVGNLIGSLGSLLFGVGLWINWLRTPSHGWLDTVIWCGFAVLMVSWLLHAIRFVAKRV